MNAFIKALSKDKIIALTFWSSLFCICIAGVLCLFYYQKLPPFVPLFNQMPWGVTRLGTKIQLIIPLLVAVIITIMNTSFALFVYEKITLIARIMSMTSFLVSLFVLLFVIRVLQLVL